MPESSDGGARIGAAPGAQLCKPLARTHDAGAEIDRRAVLAGIVVEERQFRRYRRILVGGEGRGIVGRTVAHDQIVIAIVGRRRHRGRDIVVNIRLHDERRGGVVRVLLGFGGWRHGRLAAPVQLPATTGGEAGALIGCNCGRLAGVAGAGATLLAGRRSPLCGAIDARIFDLPRSAAR